MDWNNFTPQEFVQFCKDVFTDIVLPKIKDFGEGIYNFSTWLEELSSRKKL